MCYKMISTGPAEGGNCDILNNAGAVAGRREGRFRFDALRLVRSADRIRHRLLSPVSTLWKSCVKVVEIKQC